MNRQLYCQQQREEIEKVIVVFDDYIRTTPYLEILWSHKLGCYLYIPMDLDSQDDFGLGEMGPWVIRQGKSLCRDLLHEIAHDVVGEAGKSHNIYEADAKERAEIQRRIHGYMEQLPQYKDLQEHIFDRSQGVEEA